MRSQPGPAMSLFSACGRPGEMTMLKQVLSGALLFGIMLAAANVAGAVEDKADELRQAIAACDKGATAPLDPDARAP